VASGDGFLHNDGGTMRMTNISKLADRLAGTNITASDGVLSASSSGGSSLTVGSDNQIPFTNSGGDDFDYSANFTYDGTVATLITDTDDTVVLKLKATEDTTNHGPVMDFHRDRANPADNDELGRIRFVGENSNSSQRIYAGIFAEARDVTAGSTDGIIIFESQIQNSQTEIFAAGAQATNGNAGVFPQGDNAIDLGNDSNGWQTVTARQFRGYDGSSYVDGATGAAIGIAGTDPSSGQSGTFDIQAAGGSVAGLNFQPTGGGSDVKYKENIQDYTNGLSFIDSLPTPRTFDWKSNASEIRESGSALGYVAQEVESGVLSSYVSELDCSKWDSTKDLDNYKVIDYVKLERDTLYSLINAVKELSARVKVLEG